MTTEPPILGVLRQFHIAMRTTGPVSGNRRCEGFPEWDNRTVLGFRHEKRKNRPAKQSGKHGRLSSRRYRCANQKRNLHLRNLHVLQLL